jgi:hypothetical protein
VAGFLGRGGGRVARRGRDLASRKGEVELVWGPIAGTHRRAALKLTRYRTQRTISWEEMGHGDPQSWEPVGEFNLAVACERGDLPIGSGSTISARSTVSVGQGTGKPSADVMASEVPARAPVATQASQRVPVGAVRPSITKHTTLDQSIAFSRSVYGWVDGGAKTMRFSAHTDLEDARKRGTWDAIVQGLHSAV